MPITKKRKIQLEDELNLEPLREKKEQLEQIEDIDLVEKTFAEKLGKDHLLATETIRRILDSGRQALDIGLEEFADAPSSRGAEAMATLMDKLAGVSNQLIGSYKQIADIYKTLKEREKKGQTTTHIENAIIVGNLDDVISLKEKQTKELNSVN